MPKDFKRSSSNYQSFPGNIPWAWMNQYIYIFQFSYAITQNHIHLQHKSENIISPSGDHISAAHWSRKIQSRMSIRPQASSIERMHIFITIGKSVTTLKEYEIKLTKFSLGAESISLDEHHNIWYVPLTNNLDRNLFSLFPPGLQRARRPRHRTPVLITAKAYSNMTSRHPRTAKLQAVVWKTQPCYLIFPLCSHSRTHYTNS